MAVVSALVVVLLAVSAAVANPQDDAGFLHAMKNLIFGSHVTPAPGLNVTTTMANIQAPIREVKADSLSIQRQLDGGTVHGGAPQQLMVYPRPGAVVGPSYPTAAGTFNFPQGRQSGSSCSMPQQIGTGPYRIPRWYFNPARTRCELFYWSGCCGNGNNFPTFQACQQVCEVDPCTQDQDPGVGAVQLPRFFFNKNTKLCEDFIYFGSAGNRNNFLSLEECQRRCPESPNPCAFGRPSGPFVQCSSSNMLTNTCPAGEFCHVGAGASTTVCCPKGTGDRCSQPLNIGVGNANLQRWYFNPLTQQCGPCVYRGLQGNENNFLSREDCENACFVNPCLRGSPYRSQGVTVQCSVRNEGVCPLNYYCHFGADTRTTVCCQVTGPDPCQLPLALGIGEEALQRWYFDFKSSVCRLFLYAGSAGNENNFVSVQDCNAQCPNFENACLYGEPAMNDNRQPKLCAENFPCPPGFWCHIGASAKETMCCPGAAHPCLLQTSLVGSGSSSLSRWSYDITVHQCVQFSYSGRMGNANNFLTEAQCKDACPVYANPCPFGEPVTEEATAFNAVPLPIACSADNIAFNKNCPSSSWCHVGSTKETTICCPGAGDPCSMPMAQGEAEGEIIQRLSRYYYNSKDKACYPFVYRGAKGNRNNFRSLDECVQACPVFENPCLQGEPANDYEGNPRTCSASRPDGCGADYYCHVGATAETTVCCPSVGYSCDLDILAGRGSRNLTRYGLDRILGRCVQFDYGGAGGNNNNFLTADECREQCPIFISICPVTNLRNELTSDRSLPSCSDDGACPPYSWCHFGATKDTTVCCPGGPDPCTESMVQGQGNSALPRFYYQSSSRQCLPFSYFGLRGNSNNFVTKEACEIKCPTWVNPCATGDPVMGSNQRPKQCHQGAPCQVGYFCHIGDTEATTVCCPSTSDPCSAPMANGVGERSLPRWYYNSQGRNCQPFTYRGARGNENNFMSREDCESTCPVWVNPCTAGEPILMTNNRPRQCNPSNIDSCPVTHWCHPGAESATTVCCPGKQDPCAAPVQEGEGQYSQTRWYFDGNTRQCRQFSYRGMKGNQNNFLSKFDCETSCPVFVDPCPASFGGGPVSPVQPPSCSINNPACPTTHWCHFGIDADTTLCCLGAGDPCAQTQSRGMGEASLPRWSYDATSRQCKPFTYLGSKGNQNNFLTRENCEQQCPVFENPCRTGDPFLISGRPQTCSPTYPCPTNYYCHIGATEEFVCCQSGDGGPCVQPMEPGQGTAALQRWYWNSITQRCMPFTYRGTKGTQNNFLNEADCDRTCYELDNPCANGDPAIDSNNRPIQCGTSNAVCTGDFWCHNGPSDKTTVCCPGRVEGDTICAQPMSMGSGDASLSRWYYDQVNRRCVQFSYSGRFGNQNNFQSQDDCELACPVFENVCPSGQPQLETNNRPRPCTFGSDSCGQGYWCHLGTIPDEYQCCLGQPTNPEACKGLAPLQGQGTASVPRWYYDSTTQTCKTFQYRGRKGNQNNFLTEEDCATTCTVFNNPCILPVQPPPQMCQVTNMQCPARMYCHVGANDVSTLCCPNVGDTPCNLPQERGTGASSIARWFYNQQTGTCQPFTYTGIKGNENNFLSREECENICGPNPCVTGRPFAGTDGQPQTCNALTQQNSCPSSYWCHVGASRTTTVCCPGAVGPRKCTLAMSSGEGNDNLERYYYDSASRTCRQFIYNGLKGNENNFVSLRACQLACQPLDNPCIGQPATTPQGEVVFCSSTNIANCPVNFWCHLGASPETTVCCPGATNPCSVPLAPGTGNSNLNRWYYNVDERRCVPFIYNGKRGNQNNFETQASCARTCPVWENPCMGTPERDARGRPRVCSPLIAMSCSTGYFCLAGDPSLRESSYCCPSVSPDPCNTYLNEGEGVDNLPRWYYSPLDGGCHEFLYRGRKGNENNFLTKDTCEERCHPDINPCFGSDEPLKQNNRIVQCRAETRNCPHTHYCHIGEDNRVTVCCPKRGNPCDQQLMVGTGNGDIPRFFYSSPEDACIPFNYSGLGGNENNFMTKLECEVICPGFRGFCPHGKPLIEKGKPQICGIDTACPKDYLCHVTNKESKSICCMDPASFCLLPRDPGPCNQEIVRYGYNRLTGACQNFTYGGCLGNKNNFDSLERCTEICCDKGY